MYVPQLAAGPVVAGRLIARNTLLGTGPLKTVNETQLWVGGSVHLL